MLIQIIQIVIFQALFLAFYDLWLQKETFFVANRIYLLLSSLISILLPFTSSVFSTERIIESQTQFLPEIVLRSPYFQLPDLVFSSNELFSQFAYLTWIYLAGLSFASLLFMWKLLKLLQLIYRNKRVSNADFILIELPNTSQVFSFLNYVFIGKEITEKEYLLKHEKAHIFQKHSWDLLWFEILKIALWFNPFVYLYQRRITALHEFIADAESSKNTVKSTYYNHILNDLFQVENMAFINQFYHKSLIKKRIIMMTKNKSQQWKMFKYVFILPLVVLMLFYSCNNSENESKEDEINFKTLEENTVQNDVVPFSHIDEAPIYPGCDNVKDKQEQRKCFSKEIQQHIANEFNVNLAQELGLEAGKKRMYVMFTINANGYVTDIKARAPHKSLEEEAIRVIKTLPKMTPGKVNGKVISVKYSLPISFIVV